jgi:hypothetical protein
VLDGSQDADRLGQVVLTLVSPLLSGRQPLRVRKRSR